MTHAETIILILVLAQLALNVIMFLWLDDRIVEMHNDLMPLASFKTKMSRTKKRESQ